MVDLVIAGVIILALGSVLGLVWIYSRRQLRRDTHRFLARYMKTFPGCCPICAFHRYGRTELGLVQQTLPEHSCPDQQQQPAFCGFCTCEQCLTGNTGIEGFRVRHAPTSAGGWICEICFAYDVCTSGPDRSPHPCQDPECRHRPKLTGGFVY